MKEFTYQDITGTYGSFQSWIELLLNYGGIDRQYLPKFSYVLWESFRTIPWRTYEELQFGKIIENTEIKLPPLFIIGHWRSGTTYLFNLLSQDRDFGYLPVMHGLGGRFEIFLGNPEFVRRLAEKNYPRERDDSIILFADSPCEEEHALGKYSYYMSFSFPQETEKFFKQFVSFDNEFLKIQWKKAYTRLLKKLTFSVNGKRLLLKNPVNTGRIKILLEMFPDAKFIHIYRNPYQVYASAKKLFAQLNPYYGFQTISEAKVEENIFWAYQEIMNKYLVEKTAIPPENLIEIRYEDLISNEIKFLKQIYSQFNLTEFEQKEADFQQYIEAKRKNYLEYKAQKEATKNTLSEATINKIARDWRFAIEQWQYDVPERLRG